MRTVNMIDATEVTALCEATDPHEVMKAIGYLSQWNQTFPHVELSACMGDQPEIGAAYRETPDGPLAYFICAVWHGDKFGFHS